MRPPLAVREVALAALAFLAAVVALAVTAQTRHAHTRSPQAVGSFVATAGTLGPSIGRHTVCGGVIDADTEGVAHPTLPCGARIFLTYRSTTVLVQVIDRGPFVPGEQFGVTAALARRLGLQGVQPIHWSYARAG